MRLPKAFPGARRHVLIRTGDLIFRHAVVDRTWVAHQGITTERRPLDYLPLTLDGLILLLYKPGGQTTCRRSHPPRADFWG
jgi:hypothetical protein